ncbi:unnamed protein product, partial [Mesorhabditis belari]|uniref:Cation efflux protein transmembrane domain-containing protein n=1 Tax=Mesorhabditis belari TaxID=2138241 RepID=A0AAF3FPJ3_9BILA
MDKSLLLDTPGYSNEESPITSPPQGVQDYQTITRATNQQTPEIFYANKRRLQAIRAASIGALVLIILQTVAGVASGSLAVASDAGRLFADFIEQHHYSQIDTPVYRRLELIAIFGSALVLTLINITFVVISIQHLNEGYFEILESWMLVGAILSITTNTILLFIHYKADWSGHIKQPNRLRVLWRERRAQVFHGTINHGIGGVAVLVAAIFAMKGDFTIDSIATFVIIAFSMANILSALLKVNKEYKTFRFFQQSYEIADIAENFN